MAPQPPSRQHPPRTDILLDLIDQYFFAIWPCLVAPGIFDFIIQTRLVKSANEWKAARRVRGRRLTDGQLTSDKVLETIEAGTTLSHNTRRKTLACCLVIIEPTIHTGAR